MANNSSLTSARRNKNDEFYTVYEFIQKEINAYLEYDPDVFRGKTVLLPCDDPEWSNFTRFFAQNFETLGLKKLISTSFAADSKPATIPYQLTFFETDNPQYDEKKTRSNGKIFTLTRKKSKTIDIDDLEWSYLEGDGDFRSAEVTALRDQADIIVTNPPFSLFREFVAWALEKQKSLLIIGSQNAITYKEVFPLICANRLWLGVTCNDSDMVFEVPENADVKQSDRDKAAKMGYIGNYTRLGNACWFTNLDHGRRHQEIPLMTMADNLKFSKHKTILSLGYSEYCNYSGCIEVPFVDAIPSDYKGLMGVPVTFVAKYCPEQFQIVGCADADVLPDGWVGAPQDFVDLYYEQGNTGQYTTGNRLACFIDAEGNAKIPYKRILIKALGETE